MDIICALAEIQMKNEEKQDETRRNLAEQGWTEEDRQQLDLYYAQHEKFCKLVATLFDKPYNQFTDMLQLMYWACASSENREAAALTRKYYIAVMRASIKVFEELKLDSTVDETVTTEADPKIN